MAAMNNVRGETLKREIEEKQEYNHESFKPIVTPEMLKTDKKSEKILQSMEDAYEYKGRLDTSKDIPYFQYEKMMENILLNQVSAIVEEELLFLMFPIPDK